MKDVEWPPGRTLKQGEKVAIQKKPQWGCRGLVSRKARAVSFLLIAFFLLLIPDAPYYLGSFTGIAFRLILRELSADDRANGVSYDNHSYVFGTMKKKTFTPNKNYAFYPNPRTKLRVQVHAYKTAATKTSKYVGKNERRSKCFSEKVPYANHPNHSLSKLF